MRERKAIKLNFSKEAAILQSRIKENYAFIFTHKSQLIRLISQKRLFPSLSELYKLEQHLAADYEIIQQQNAISLLSIRLHKSRDTLSLNLTEIEFHFENLQQQIRYLIVLTWMNNNNEAPCPSLERKVSSTTDLLNQFEELYSTCQEAYLWSLKSKFKFHEIHYKKLVQGFDSYWNELYIKGQQELPSGVSADKIKNIFSKWQAFKNKVLKNGELFKNSTSTDKKPATSTLLPLRHLQASHRVFLHKRIKRSAKRQSLVEIFDTAFKLKVAYQELLEYEKQFYQQNYRSLSIGEKSIINFSRPFLLQERDSVIKGLYQQICLAWEKHLRKKDRIAPLEKIEDLPKRLQKHLKNSYLIWQGIKEFAPTYLSTPKQLANEKNRRISVWENLISQGKRQFPSEYISFINSQDYQALNEEWKKLLNTFDLEIAKTAKPMPNWKKSLLLTSALAIISTIGLVASSGLTYLTTLPASNLLAIGAAAMASQALTLPYAIMVVLTTLALAIPIGIICSLIVAAKAAYGKQEQSTPEPQSFPKLIPSDCLSSTAKIATNIPTSKPVTAVGAPPPRNIALKPDGVIQKNDASSCSMSLKRTR